jgi:hypothetical protein
MRIRRSVLAQSLLKIGQLFNCWGMLHKGNYDQIWLLSDTVSLIFFPDSRFIPIWITITLTESKFIEKTRLLRITYNSTLNACEKAADWLGALLLLEELERESVEADVITYSAPVQAIGRHIFSPIFTTKAGEFTMVYLYTWPISPLPRGGRV